jgi:hypothetical protein
MKMRKPVQVQDYEEDEDEDEEGNYEKTLLLARRARHGRLPMSSDSHHHRAQLL